MDSDRVEPCATCGRHVRTSEASCPFCDAPHASAPRIAPPRAPTRAMLAAWAGLFVAACGGGETADDGPGGDVVPDGSSGGEDGVGDAEASCAGVCGSHHHPPCVDDPEDPCPAPPYGAPPLDDDSPL